jgi:hypothetical protein
MLNRVRPWWRIYGPRLLNAVRHDVRQRDAATLFQAARRRRPAGRARRGCAYFLPRGPGGLSRWAGTDALKITGFVTSEANGPTGKPVTMQPARFVLYREAEDTDSFQCTYGCAIHDLQGRCFARMFSPPDRFEARKGDGRRVEMIFNPLQIGPRVYTIGVSVLHETTIEDANTADRYELLSRSFTLEIGSPDSMGAMSADFMHTSEWELSTTSLPETPADDDAYSGKAGRRKIRERRDMHRPCH